MHTPPTLDQDTRHLLHAQARAEALRLRQQAINDAGDALWQAAQHAAHRAAGWLQARLRAHTKLHSRLNLG
ncbi:MAG: hypothetical protein U5L74_10350 [Ideonella sp.]|nr:hypothetical protein [Ideonella sp.]